MKKIAIILSIILAMGVLSACGKQNNSSSTPAQSTPPPAISQSAPPATSQSTPPPATSQSAPPEDATQNTVVSTIEGKAIEGTLSEIMAKLYEGTEEDVPKTMDTELNEENSVTYLGVERSTYKEGLGSDAMVSAQAHSVCLVRGEDAKAAAEIATQINDKADPRKWICVGADKKQVIQSGDLVLLVMSNTAAADKIIANFEALTK